MPHVFISYRRADSADISAQIYDGLVAILGRETVFRDIQNIPAGEDFRATIERELISCDVVLVVIGPNWLEIRDENGGRRIDDPKDVVRIEVEMALRQKNIKVIPVLVNNAEMPKPEDLPPSLYTLAFRNAAALRDNANLTPELKRLANTFVPRHIRQRRLEVVIAATAVCLFLLSLYLLTRSLQSPQVPTIVAIATEAPLMEMSAMEAPAIEQVTIGSRDDVNTIEVTVSNPLDRDVLVRHIEISKDVFAYVVCCCGETGEFVFSDEISVESAEGNTIIFGPEVIRQSGELAGYSFPSQGSVIQICGDSVMRLSFDTSFLLPKMQFSAFFISIPKHFRVVDVNLHGGRYDFDPDVAEEELAYLEALNRGLETLSFETVYSPDYYPSAEITMEILTTLSEPMRFSINLLSEPSELVPNQR